MPSVPTVLVIGQNFWKHAGIVMKFTGKRLFHYFAALKSSIFKKRKNPFRVDYTTNSGLFSGVFPENGQSVHMVKNDW